MKISLLCHDLSCNAFGRAYLLADILRRRHEVTVLGPAFGGTIWPPFSRCPFPVKLYPGSRWPGFLATARQIGRDATGDLLYAVKALPSSFGIALAARGARPLLLDVDDWELGFVEAEEEARGIPAPLRWLKGWLPGLSPNGKALVRWLEGRAPEASALTTVSEFLSAKYGGRAHLVPHARDTSWLSPERFPAGPARERLGLSGCKVVMYLGSARGYKGVEELAEAVARLPGAVLALVGTPVEDPLVGGLRSRHGDAVRAFGPVPFEQLPEWLAAADVVALPQRRDPRTLGQMPAKLTDALALGKPVVVSDLAGMRELVGSAGRVVAPGDTAGLERALAEILGDPEAASRMGQEARRIAVERLSYDAAERALEAAIAQATR